MLGEWRRPHCHAVIRGHERPAAAAKNAVGETLRNGEPGVWSNVEPTARAERPPFENARQSSTSACDGSHAFVTALWRHDFGPIAELMGTWGEGGGAHPTGVEPDRATALPMSPSCAHASMVGGGVTQD